MNHQPNKVSVYTSPLTLDRNLFDFRESTFEKAPQTDRAYKCSILRDPFFPLQTSGHATTTIDYYRKRKAPHIIEPIHDIDERRITDTYTCPSQDITRQELREQLRKAVEHLTPTRKRVFLLYYVHEMPVKTIATHLKRSEGTIKTHLRNARLQLRELLTPYLQTEV